MQIQLKDQLLVKYIKSWEADRVKLKTTKTQNLMSNTKKRKNITKTYRII